MWPFLDMWGSLSANREFRDQNPSIFRSVLSLTRIGPSVSEAAFPYAAFKEAGFIVRFATEPGKAPEYNKRIMEGVTGKLYT
jgi:hypothetical protein